MEAERRAEEFREELRDSYYYAPKNPRNSKKNNFQSFKI